MALPLPRVVADVGPGGGLVTAMQGMNALTASNLNNQIKRVEAQYAPQMTAAELAYKQAQTPYIQAQTGLTNEQAKYFGKNILSEIALRQAQTGAIPYENALKQAQTQQVIEDAKKLQFLREHPGSYLGEEGKTLEALKLFGYLPQNYGQQPSSNQNANSIAIPPASGVMPGTQVTTPSNSLQQPIAQPQANNAFQPSINPSAPFNTGNPLADAILNRKYAQPAYQQAMGKAFDWVHTTPEAKTYEIAVGAGMGMTPDQFVHERTQGKSIAQIAQEQGYDPNNLPPPDFLPTRQNITMLKRRQAALKEVDSLGKFVREGLAPFASTISGYSIPQIAAAISGSDKQKQIDFLAARMLTPELANIRQNLAQGNAGITAAQEIMHRSLMNHKAFQAFVTPDVFLKAQEKADKVLKDAFSEAEKVYQVGGKAKGGKKPVSEMSTDEIEKELADLRKRKK